MDTPKPDKDGIIIINGRRMRIEPSGEITALDGKDLVSKGTPEEQAKQSEQANLDYLLNNHPDRLDDADAARARRDELNKELGINHDDAALADKKKQLRAGILKAQMRAKMIDMTQEQQNG